MEPTSAAQTGQTGIALPAASATVALRSSKPLPGSTAVASAVPFWLRLVAEPALAQTVYTVPGARVDAVGATFAIADSSGVADFFYLPVNAYRFVVSTPDSSTVLQTLATAGVGEDLDLVVNEKTTAGTLLAVSAAEALDGISEGADLEALIARFDSQVDPAYNALLSAVSDQIGGGSDWLNNDFRPSGLALQQAIDTAQQTATYRAMQVPWQGQAVVSTQPLMLILAFNNPLDPSTTPGANGVNWRLTGPLGEINQSNIGQFGEAGYSGNQRITIAGRVIPTNSIYFVLNGVAPSEGANRVFELSLDQYPKDLSGREVIASRPASSFARWDFYTTALAVPGAQVFSNVQASVTFSAEACDGPTNAELAPYSNEVLALAGATPNSVELTYIATDGPLVLPYDERNIDLNINDPDTMQLGDVYSVRGPQDEFGFDLRVDDRVYISGNAGPSEDRFRATAGSVTVTGLQSGRIELLCEVTMSAASSGATGSYCLSMPVVIQFP